MAGVICSYPARFETDEAGRLVDRFPDLPEALTDGADETEALAEASDCLSEALASRIVDAEDIPPPSPTAPGTRVVSPDPTIALKSALYTILRAQGVTLAEFARRLGIEERQAARLVDPHARTTLSSLEEALSLLGYAIAVEVQEKRVA